MPRSRPINESACPPRCSASLRIGGGLGSVTLSAAAAADGEATKLPTIQMAAYNGGAMDVGWSLPVVIDLRGLDISGRSRPLLKDHDAGQVVGHTTDVRKVDGRSLMLDGVVSGTGPAAREVVANAGNGFPWQASVGVATRNYEYVREGSTANANGQEFAGPLYIVRKGVLAEVSVVAIGADSTTHTSIAARNHNQGETDMDFDAWIEAKGFDSDTITDEQRVTLKAAFDAEQETGEPAGADPVLEFRKAQAAETRRIADIRAKCAGAHSEIEARAIADGWTVEAAELAVLRAERAKAPQAPAGHARGGGAPAIRARAITASLAMRAGVPEESVAKERGMTDQVMEAALSRDVRRIGLHGLMHECIQAAGGHAPYGQVDSDFIRAAFEANQRLIASGGFSGLSLTNILGAVANKVALNAFESIEMVATRFAHLHDASDFKTYTVCRLMENGSFQKVGPGGELKHGSFSEDAYTNRVETRGQILTLTRQDIINDDLGLFARIMGALGRNAALALETDAFTELMANTGSFFSSGNGNYISGSGTVLGIDGFTQLEQKMLDMKDSSGKPILMTPKKLVVPTSLKVTADLLMKELRVNETTTADKGRPAANPHAGKCEVLASPFINSAAITGNSSTAWFLFGDPDVAPALQIAYLRGQRTPTIESGDTDFDTLGMSWRGYFDFKAKLMDPRGACMSKGAA
jgi:hypothetical protein